eukprot:scaffold98994_cov63-Phaeocystis_antarctica.AAC.2
MSRGGGPPPQAVSHPWMLWMEGCVGARATGPWRSAAFPCETFRFPPTNGWGQQRSLSLPVR